MKKKKKKRGKRPPTITWQKKEKQGGKEVTRGEGEILGGKTKNGGVTRIEGRDGI